MHSLPIFVRLRGRPVLLLGEGEPVEAKRRLLDRAGACIVGDGTAATLAIVGPDVAEARIVALRAGGVLVNAVDRPELCDFTLPAIVERDPVLVAIGTGGASAGLAAALRQRLETILPARMGRIADVLERARGRLRTAFPDASVRRRAIGALVAPGGPLDPLVAHDHPEAALDLAGGKPPEGRTAHVRVTSPDPEELTLRAARLLGQADRIHHDAAMPAAILDRSRADAARIVGPAPVVPEAGLTVVLVWSPA